MMTNIIVDIKIDREFVVIDGTQVLRREGVSPSQWLYFWDCAVGAEDAEVDLLKEVDDASDEITRLEGIVSDREETIKGLEGKLEDIFLKLESLFAFTESGKATYNRGRENERGLIERR